MAITLQASWKPTKNGYDQKPIIHTYMYMYMIFDYTGMYLNRKYYLCHYLRRWVFAWLGSLITFLNTLLQCIFREIYYRLFFVYCDLSKKIGEHLERCSRCLQTVRDIRWLCVSDRCEYLVWTLPHTRTPINGLRTCSRWTLTTRWKKQWAITPFI